MISLGRFQQWSYWKATQDKIYFIGLSIHQFCPTKPFSISIGGIGWLKGNFDNFRFYIFATPDEINFVTFNFRSCIPDLAFVQTSAFQVRFLPFEPTQPCHNYIQTEEHFECRPFFRSGFRWQQQGWDTHIDNVHPHEFVREVHLLHVVSVEKFWWIIFVTPVTFKNSSVLFFK